MINSGLTFGSEGPIMEGTWYNAHTGDSFTVRNSFFEDNQFIVQTTDGRVLNYEQIQNYVKSDKPIEMKKLNLKNEALPAEVASIIEDSYMTDIDMMGNYNDDMTMSLGNLNTNTPRPAPDLAVSNVVSNDTTNLSYNIISKALSKRELPDFQIGIDWLNCPTKEMNMLVELMDVKEDEIIDWYLDQVDIEATTMMIKEVLKSHITEQLHPITEQLIPVTSDKAHVQKSTKTKTTKKK